jgi:hypothetical protein
MQQQIERDHYPEIVENDQGARRLELFGIQEELRDPSDRRAFFSTLTDDQLKHMTGYINSVTRGSRVSYAYADGEFTDGATPPLEDKERLMKLAFKTVREIVADHDLDDKIALRRAGLAIAGAINYIHAYKNGNGRTARIMQYLIEFGTERGDKAVNEELYALIGKLPVYETDDKTAIDNTPHPALDRALEAKVREKMNPSSYADLSAREVASSRVAVFLDMMRGAVNVPINERVVMSRVKQGRRYNIEFAEPGEVDGMGLTERQYLRLSALPNRLPNEVPSDARRIMAKKPEVVAVEAGGLALQDFMQEIVE